jgi:hypothetical protein
LSLLEEIQKEAVDSGSDVGALLRKCKVLAARLGSQPLEDWLLWESNGYPDDVQVPDYRIWPLQLKGHFSGPFGSGMKNAPIPLICLPEDVREKYEKYECRQSIASIEQLIKGYQKGSLYVPTGDLSVFLGTNVYKGQNCVQAWAEFGVGSLLELLNAVRNRILDFSLAIWKENPNAGDTSTHSGKAIEPARVTQIFNTTVYGGAANLIGNAPDSRITFNLITNDFSSLEDALLRNGISKEDVEDLRAALEADTRPASKERFGPRVSAWISGMMKKAAEGSWSVTISVAGNLLAKAISKYYGFQ